MLLLAVEAFQAHRNALALIKNRQRDNASMLLQIADTLGPWYARRRPTRRSS
jgi:hypothetical protein